MAVQCSTHTQRETERQRERQTERQTDTHTHTRYHACQCSFPFTSTHLPIAFPSHSHQLLSLQQQLASAGASTTAPGPQVQQLTAQREELLREKNRVQSELDDTSAALTVLSEAAKAVKSRMLVLTAEAEGQPPPEAYKPKFSWRHKDVHAKYMQQLEARRQQQEAQGKEAGSAAGEDDEEDIEAVLTRKVFRFSDAMLKGWFPAMLCSPVAFEWRVCVLFLLPVFFTLVNAAR